MALKYSLRSYGLLRDCGAWMLRGLRRFWSSMTVILFDRWMKEVSDAYDEVGEVISCLGAEGMWIQFGGD